MTDSATTSTKLQRVWDRHREEAARLRNQYADPEEAVSSFIREHFDREALEEALRASLEGETLWDDDEEANGW